jgi:hypothetical protein
MPASFEPVVPLDRTSNNLEWVNDSTFLYRHRRSESEEEEILYGDFSVEKILKPFSYETPPRLNLIWTDSGNSIALYLNGEPWAFIAEKTRKGYSKGILSPKIGEPWSQRLFESTFTVD